MNRRDGGLDPVWIRRFHAAPRGAVRLVCLPHAGGSASFYAPVSAALSTSAEVLAVQYPGRQDRRAEGQIASIEGLAEQIFEVLRPVAHEPLALFGHSMGAVVAFEIALRMRGASCPPPIRLFASGRRAPSRHRDEHAHRLPDEELVAELRLLGGPNTEMFADPEFAAMVLTAVRGDYRAIESYRYRPGPPLDCPVTVLVGDRDPRVSVAEASSWSEHTTGVTDLHVFPGGHFFLTEQPAQVIDLVAATLAAAHRTVNAVQTQRFRFTREAP